MAAVEFIGTVSSFQYITPSVFVIGFTPSTPISFRAGQFLSVIIPGAGPGGRDLRRAYSIASPPEQKSIEICVKKVDGGPGTSFLAGLTLGKEVRLVAPYGEFVYKTRPDRDCFFVATGTGVSPFRAMALSDQYRAAPPRTSVCVLGVRTEDELLYTEMAKMPGMKYVGMVSQPKSAWAREATGRVTDFLRALPADFRWLETDFYLCGNGEMIKEVKGILTGHGVGKEAIHLEKYY